MNFGLKNNARDVEFTSSDAANDDECNGVGLVEISEIFVTHDDFVNVMALFIRNNMLVSFPTISTPTVITFQCCSSNEIKTVLHLFTVTNSIEYSIVFNKITIHHFERGSYAFPIFSSIK